jgi:hypothetical protein
MTGETLVRKAVHIVCRELLYTSQRIDCVMIFKTTFYCSVCLFLGLYETNNLKVEKRTVTLYLAAYRIVEIAVYRRTAILLSAV